MSCGFSSKKQISVFKHNDIIQEEEHGYYGKAQKFLFKKCLKGCFLRPSDRYWLIISICCLTDSSCTSSKTERMNSELMPQRTPCAPRLSSISL